MSMALEPFDAYRFYNALKLHFAGKYDAVKYQYKTSANPKSFWKRRDKFFFAKIAKKFNDPHDLINYYVAHFIEDGGWVGDMIGREEVYTQWLKVQESLGYYFEQDLIKLEDKCEVFDELFAMKENQYPLIVQEYLAGEINLETLAIFENLFGVMNKLDAQITDTIVWPDIKLKVQKYAPFVKMDQKKVKKIVMKVFTN